MRKSPIPKLVLLLPLLSACALCEQITASRLIVATLLHTPKLEDPSLPEALPEKTELTVFVGDRGSDVTEPPKATEGAKVTLIFPLAPEGVALQESLESPGTYLLSSTTPNSGLQYLDEQEYRLEVDDGQDLYIMKVTLPKPSAGAGLDPRTTTEQQRNATLSLKHPDPEELAFVTVTRAPDPLSGCLFDPTKSDLVTYSSVPDEPQEALSLIDNDGRWREDPIEVPGDAFPDCGLYTVIVSTMAKGLAETPNVFIGSQFLAGKAEGGLFRVR